MSGTNAGGPVSVDVDIEDGRTTIEVTGQRRVATVVRSASGERIYLPPERTDEEEEATPYRPAGGDSPYEGIADDSPYGSSRRAPATLGRSRTANGFRIVHPEPVTDVRLLR
ncbi:DUF7510 family protein [Halosimplex halophilum]|uniref:DUF7510 family protein n=1 Tax=Halosimplex halophilum TaxID=2559572 RepID=UPI00107F7BF1|nr:hypothetical protein [Halosimplex halophilum]